MQTRFSSLLLAAVLLAPAAAVAQPATSTVPKCASGDPVVLMNTKTKTYTILPKTASTGTGSTIESPSGTTKAMCLSKAQAMGGKSIPDSSETQPMARPGTNGSSNGANGTGNASTNNGGAGPYTSQSPAPAGTSNAGTPPPGAPSHSP